MISGLYVAYLLKVVSVNRWVFYERSNHLCWVLHHLRQKSIHSIIIKNTVLFLSSLMCLYILTNMLRILRMPFSTLNVLRRCNTSIKGMIPQCRTEIHVAENFDQYQILDPNPNIFLERFHPKYSLRRNNWKWYSSIFILFMYRIEKRWNLQFCVEFQSKCFRWKKKFWSSVCNFLICDEPMKTVFFKFLGSNHWTAMSVKTIVCSKTFQQELRDRCKIFLHQK